MLQNLKKVGYNRLSRRWMLRVFGVSIGVVAIEGILSGCSLIKNKVESSNNVDRFIPLSSKEQQLVSAFSNVNKRLLKKAVKDIIEARSNLKQNRSVYSSILRARQAFEQVFNHFNSIGLTKAIEAYTVRFALENYNDLNPQIIQALEDDGFTETEIRQSRDLVRQARDRLLPIASALHMPQIMADIITKLKKAEELYRPLSAAYDSKAMFDMDKLLNCLSMAFLLGATGLHIVGHCVACSMPGNILAPMNCLICLYGLVAYITAYDAYLDGCVM